LLLTSDNSQTVIFASYDGGTNAFTIDLRDNGEYEIKNSSWLTSNDFHGHYTILDSIVTLDKKNIDNVILTNKLKICICPYYKSKTAGQTFSTCLMQVDEQGNNIDTHFGFTIRVDKRK
jgi:hypothetical protein